MTKATENRLSPYLSPIVVNNGLLRGCAFIPGTLSIQVAIFLDGNLLTQVVSDTPLLSSQPVLPGKAPDYSYGFLVPLPARLFDGAPHELIARLYKPKQKLARSTTPNLKQSWLLESKLLFQQGDRHGQVKFVDGHFQGWVAFSHRPNPLPQLILNDQEGNFLKQVALIPVPTEQRKPDNYQASFRIPKKNLPIPLRFFCGEMELNGSPCHPRKILIGNLDKFNRQAICGWAFDLHQPASPVELTLKIDGQIVQYFRPNIRRPDIAEHLNLPKEELGIVGFQITPPEILFDGQAHHISVEFSGQNHLLRGSGQRVCIPKNYLMLDEILPQPESIRLPKKLVRPKAPLVSVIILNRNGEKLLAALLESWKEKNSLNNIELIVIDHASQDDSLRLLHRWQSQLPLHVIPLSINDSFSASCNRAAREARGKFLLFLNNDIIWLQDVLPAMVETLEQDQDIGIVGLKLIKSSGHEHLYSQALVQHLGIRFKLVQTTYWPYEADADDLHEAEYAAQIVPAVTGAVMFCRKEDFCRAGMFDPTYFYGFEDVEFCLRFSNRLGKKIICRNDLLALHHHGHTRLSGRATDIIDRMLNNEGVLQAHAGLWLKQHYWKSLLAADQHLTVDQLTIGFVIDEPMKSGETTRLRTEAGKLAKQVLACHPTARVVFLPPSRGWYDVRNIHMLIVGHPEYDLGKMTCRREDLLTFAWIRGDIALWRHAPWWPHFDCYLAAPRADISALAPTISSPIVRATAARPLGPLVNPQSPPLRVALLMPAKILAEQQAQCDTLQRSLQAAGAVVWQDPCDTPNGSSRVADVRITFSFNKILPKIRMKAQPHTLNILWAPHIKQTQKAITGQDWRITSQMPEAEWLRNELEKTLGNTFCSP